MEIELRSEKENNLKLYSFMENPNLKIMKNGWFSHVIGHRLGLTRHPLSLPQAIGRSLKDHTPREEIRIVLQANGEAAAFILSQRGHSPVDLPS